MNDLLIITTFKNNLFYQKPFYNFYRKVWKPKKILFYIGYSENFEKTFYDSINNLSIKIDINKYIYIKQYHKFANEIKIYNHEFICLIFYHTVKYHNSPGEWDIFRKTSLYDLHFTHLKKELFDYNYSFSCDCDDFFYVNNPEEKIKEKGPISFHVLEFIPHDKLSLEQDFKFISYHYFFRIKGNLGYLEKNKRCSYCRIIVMNQKLTGLHSDFHKSICDYFYKNTENNQDLSLEDSNQYCFSFGCLDKDCFMNSIHWDQSTKDVTMLNKLKKEECENNFNKYYKLTQEECKNNIIVNVNELKVFF